MSKTAQIILDLLMTELKDTTSQFDKYVNDIQFDVNSRILIFKLKDKSRWSYNKQQSFSKLQKSIIDYIKERCVDLLVVFIEDDIEIQMLTDEQLKAIGLQRIPKDEQG